MEMVVLSSLRHFSWMAAPFQTPKRKTKQHIKKEGKEAKQDKTRTDGSQSLGEPLENNTGRSMGHGGAVGYGKKLATGGGQLGRQNISGKKNLGLTRACPNILVPRPGHPTFVQTPILVLPAQVNRRWPSPQRNKNTRRKITGKGDWDRHAFG